MLLLHGGGGPGAVEPWADRLAAAHPARVLVPTYPGFEGTERPESLDGVRPLAAVQVALLEALDLRDVLVVGNSIGGWVAAEVALLGSERVTGVVLVDAVGADLPGHPVADFFSLTPAGLAQRSYHDPDRYGVDPAVLPPEVRAAMAANRPAIAAYGGDGMVDPTLLDRLTAVRTPTLVVWGEADRIADAEVGRAMAAAVPGGRFELVRECGHLPQIEQPDVLVDLVRRFVDELPPRC
ncbi:alpha/beta hydrolase [Angustibacter aerolatus]